MKQLGWKEQYYSLPEWDASPFQGTPPTIRRYQFLLPTGERHCERKVFRLRTQHNDPIGFGNPDILTW